MNLLSRLTRNTACLWLALTVIPMASCSVPPRTTPTLPGVSTLTRTPIDPTLTPRPTEVSATPTTRPTATPWPTRQPDATFWANVEQYRLLSASTVGPEGVLYTFNALLDDSAEPGACDLYFFRWDGYDYRLIQQLHDPTSCEVTNWDFYKLDLEQRRALHLQGYWSDVNNNGLPELTVYYFPNCPIGCDKPMMGETAVYEIQDAEHIQNITAGLPSQLVPGTIRHTDQPWTIYLHEWFSFGRHTYVDMAWIYQWDGEQFVNVSSTYLEEYQQQVDEALVQLKAHYGQALVFADVEALMRLLVIYNELSFPPQEALESFLEVTQPAHWPGTDQRWHCWLQLARAQAQLDYERQLPFQLYSVDGINMAPSLSDLTRDLDAQRFDLSACQ